MLTNEIELFTSYLSVFVNQTGSVQPLQRKRSPEIMMISVCKYCSHVIGHVRVCASV